MIGYVEFSPVPLRRTEIAMPFLPLIITLGPTMSVDGRVFGSFLAGLYERPVETAFTGEQRGVQVNLTPLAAYRLFGGLVADLADATVEPPGTAELGERLAAEPDWSARYALVNRWLAGRLADGPSPDPAVRWAWRRLSASGGRIPVGALAAEIGWSRRHFSARFRAHTGLPPKPVARLMRFERAASLVGAGHPLASVADLAGYADQAHLTREFVRLSGTPPGRYRVTNVQDPAPAGV
jgi:AraC-like DNA-binding protein